jgi:zinc and cadmium transporter
MMCPLGAALFFLGMTQFAGQQQVVLGCALAFSAGVFLCISLGDLLPEIEFHSHDRIKLSVMILIGISAAYLIGFLEPEHAHRHEKNVSQGRGENQSPGIADHSQSLQ